MLLNSRDLLSDRQPKASLARTDEDKDRAGKFHQDNAIEGVARFPGSLVISSIETGNSAILMWIEKPSYDRGTNIVRFSGISPGGFQGKRAFQEYAKDIFS